MSLVKRRKEMEKILVNQKEEEEKSKSSKIGKEISRVLSDDG